MNLLRVALIKKVEKGLKHIFWCLCGTGQAINYQTFGLEQLAPFDEILCYFLDTRFDQSNAEFKKSQLSYRYYVSL